MQKIHFFKYQGTGNDFVMIDNRNLAVELRQKEIAQICDRRFGVGADGLILLQNHQEYDFQMVYYNADGKKSSMCGNGGRCIVKFAQFLEVFDKETKFLAIDGMHEASIDEQNRVHLKMQDVQQVEVSDNYFFLDTGSPHYVEYVENVENFAVFEKGRAIRNNDRFRAEGTNVNFVEKLEDTKITVRTYERGVEDETFSCGTGVTAAALVSGLEGIKSPVKIQTKGGNLEVSFDSKENGGFKNIFLIGAADFVFEGKIEI